MNKKTFVTLVIGIIMVGFTGLAFAGEGWTTYKSNDYGFSMLIPTGTKFAEKEYGGGWGALYGEYEGVQLWAIGKLGAPETPEAIEKFGVKVTGIAAKYWKHIDKGEYVHGWKWYKTVKAASGDTVVYGGYGAGAKGNYLLLLVTTKTDFKENYDDYMKWYKSIKLF